MFPAVTSAFKEKYPLAPKKFWKKMLSSVFGNLTVSGMFAMFCGIIGIMLPTIINRKASYLIGFLALLVGLARVAAGVHHLVDIIGSIIIAVVVTATIQLLLKRYTKFVL